MSRKQQDRRPRIGDKGRGETHLELGLRDREEGIWTLTSTRGGGTDIWVSDFGY